MAYYWEQRWEQELLLYLFVHSVRVRSLDDTTEPDEYYENRPIKDAKGGLQRIEKFGHWVTEFLETKPLFVRKEANIGPCLDRKEVNELDDLVAAAKEGLTLTEVEQGRYQLQQQKPDMNLTSEREAGVVRERDAICKRAKENTPTGAPKGLEVAVAEASKECSNLSAAGELVKHPYLAKVCGYREWIADQLQKKKLECPSLCPIKEDSTTNRQSAVALGPPGSFSIHTFGPGKGGKQVAKEITLFLRSPDGILYYLGELMRAEEETGIVPEICIEGRLEPLFVAFSKSTPGQVAEPKCPATVSVQYDGSEFLIPRGDVRQPTPGGFQCPESEDDRVDADQQQAVRESDPKYLEGLENLHCWPGRSMQVLSLVEQLIALQKSAKDTPTTSVIRAISQ